MASVEMDLTELRGIEHSLDEALSATMEKYQEDIGKWLVECFGNEIAEDSQERAFRFIEESLELVQSMDVSKEQIHQIVDYVYSRPVGELQQEIGGTIVTIAALCFAKGISLKACADEEHERIKKNVEKIRAKHNSKPKNIVSILPGVILKTKNQKL